MSPIPKNIPSHDIPLRLSSAFQKSRRQSCFRETSEHGHVQQGRKRLCQYPGIISWLPVKSDRAQSKYPAKWRSQIGESCYQPLVELITLDSLYFSTSSSGIKINFASFVHLYILVVLVLVGNGKKWKYRMVYASISILRSRCYVFVIISSPTITWVGSSEVLDADVLLFRMCLAHVFYFLVVVKKIGNVVIFDDEQGHRKCR